MKEEIMSENKHLTLLSDQIGIMYHYYYQFKNNLYGSNDMEKRKDLGQFYTPPQLSSKMLEKYDCDLKEFRNKTILDPTAGSGLLLLDSLIAGSEPDRVFGIELDEEVLSLAHDRLCNEKNPVKVPDLDYSGDVVTVKPYKEGDDFIEIPDAEYSADSGITYDNQENYDVSKLWDTNTGKIKDGVRTRRVKVKNVVIPKYNIHQGDALQNNSYIFPESKYEDAKYKNDVYKFENGQAKLEKKNGGTSFSGWGSL